MADTETAEQIGEATSGFRWLSDEDAHAIFAAEARKAVGPSGEEFLRRYDAGEFDEIADDPDHPAVMRLAMLISFGR